jgi:hypothetical protein
VIIHLPLFLCPFHRAAVGLTLANLALLPGKRRNHEFLLGIRLKKSNKTVACRRGC